MIVSHDYLNSNGTPVGYFYNFEFDTRNISHSIEICFYALSQISKHWKFDIWYNEEYYYDAMTLTTSGIEIGLGLVTFSIYYCTEELGYKPYN
jgi:hypothetical protein